MIENVETVNAFGWKRADALVAGDSLGIYGDVVTITCYDGRVSVLFTSGTTRIYRADNMLGVRAPEKLVDYLARNGIADPVRRVTMSPEPAEPVTTPSLTERLWARLDAVTMHEMIVEADGRGFYIVTCACGELPESVAFVSETYSVFGKHVIGTCRQILAYTDVRDAVADTLADWEETDKRK